MLKIDTSNRYWNENTNKYYVIMSISDGDVPPNTIEDQEVINYILTNSNVITFPDGIDIVEELNNKVTKQELEEYIRTINEFTEELYPVYTFDDIDETAEIKKFTLEEKLKLENIQNNSNNYTHPNSHSADMIIDSSNKLFMTPDERSKLENIQDNSNNYIHPYKHSADIVEENIMKNFVTMIERINWNKKPNIEDVDDRINIILGADPKVVSTLNSLKDILNSSEISQKILTQLSNKIDKVNNKQLSTEDYTSEEKLKLQSIEFGTTKYIHPQTHPASMLEDLDLYIENNNKFKELINLKHTKLHAIDDVYSHIGFRNTNENNIPIFTNNGMLKDSFKTLPMSNIIGTDDIQNIKNKTIENSSIGLETPSEGNFTTISGIFNTTTINGEYYITEVNCRGNKFLINDDTKILLANTNQCLDGSNVEFIVIKKCLVEVIPDIYNRIILNGEELPFGKAIVLNNQMSVLSLLKDSANGWIVTDTISLWELKQ